MQIVAQSSDRLVLHESPWGLRVMGAVLAVFGFGVLTVMVRGAHAGEHNAWVAFVVGGTFGAVGLALLATAADREVVFDRATKTARLTRRGGVLRAMVNELPFSTIRDIALESSTMGATTRSATTSYRIVFVLRDDSRLPWTTLLTGDVGRQASCVAAARAFGGWDAAAARSGAASTEVARPTPPPGVPTVTPAPAAFAVMPRSPAAQAAKANGGCVIAFLGIFVLVGAGMALVQVDHYLEWEPAPARVVTSHMDAVRGSKGGTSYRPSVTYSYEVGGRSYVSSAVTIINESASMAWASEIVARYRPGSATVAYVDPGNPTKAYLVHELSIIPFVFIVIPIVFGGIIVLSIRWNARQTTLAAALPVPVLTARGIAPSKAA